jgi:hypothetical protein
MLINTKRAGAGSGEKINKFFFSSFSVPFRWLQIIPEMNFISELLSCAQRLLAELRLKINTNAADSAGESFFFH